MVESNSSLCISCGLNKIFFNRLCQRCYLENNPFLKKIKELKIVVCNRCDLVSSRGNWSNHFLVDITNGQAYSWISSLISKEWEFYYRPKNITIQKIDWEYDYEGYPANLLGLVEIEASPDAFVPLIKFSEEFNIKIDWGECSECRIRLSGEYNSKIQVRSSKEIDSNTLEQWGKEISALSESYPLSDGKNPLFKLIYIKTGLDALFQARAPANSVGRQFARNHGGIVSVTTEFAGFDKSRSREYPRKPVVLVNLLEYDPGDILIFNDLPIQILGYKNNKVDYWDFKKGITARMPIKTFIESKPQFIDQEIREFQVINFEQKELTAQIMDTATFETYYVNLEELNGKSEGEIFSGILYEGKLLIKK